MTLDDYMNLARNGDYETQEMFYQSAMELFNSGTDEMKAAMLLSFAAECGHDKAIRYMRTLGLDAKGNKL